MTFGYCKTAQTGLQDILGQKGPLWAQKTHPKGPRRAKIGTNASHAVQLTSLGPKKTDLNPTPQRSAPLTWNQPTVMRIEEIM